MECKEAVSWIHEYLDGTLGGQAQLQLKQHLQHVRLQSTLRRHWS